MFSETNLQTVPLQEIAVNPHFAVPFYNLTASTTRPTPNAQPGNMINQGLEDVCHAGVKNAGRSKRPWFANNQSRAAGVPRETEPSYVM